MHDPEHRVIAEILGLNHLLFTGFVQQQQQPPQQQQHYHLPSFSFASNGSNGQHPLPVVDHRFFKELFGTLDRDGDGHVTEEDLYRELKRLSLPTPRLKIQKLFSRLDTNQDGKISQREFAEFVANREKRLWKVFRDLDVNGDGKLCHADLQRAALKLTGVQINRHSLEHLIHRADLSQNGSIAYEDFRKLLLLAPTLTTQEIFTFWRDAANLDAGDFEIPEALTTQGSFDTFVAGGCAGAVSRTATAPLDRLKVLLQAQVPGQPKVFNGVADGAKYIYQHGGHAAFFKGNGVNVIKVAPETALKFFFFEKIKASCCNHKDITLKERIFAGSAAGMLAQAAIYPMEIAKTRLALGEFGDIRHPTTLYQCLSGIVRKESWRGLYRGLTPSLIGIAPYAGVDLAVYSLLKDLYAKRNPQNRDPSILVLLLCGATSSTCGMLVSYPLQLVRTRMQAQGAQQQQQQQHHHGNSKVQYNGIMDCMTKAYRADGIWGLYRGILPNFMKTLPAVSISYATYDTVLKYLQRVQQRHLDEGEFFD